MRIAVKGGQPGWLALCCLTMLLGVSSARASGLTDGRWIDLTHDFSEQSIYWPTASGFRKTTVFEGVNDRGFYYSAYDINLAEHGGTHMDAPVHFAEGAHGADKVPLEKMIGPAAVIDVSAKAAADRDYQITVADVLDWERRHGRLVNGAIVLFNTGSSRFWPDRVKYMGTDKRGEEGVRALSFPGIHPDTARLLTDQRTIKAVGLDTPSIDYGKSTNFMTHRILFQKNIPGFENVANLDAMPAKGAYVFALPMKIKDGSGAPLRIVGFVSAN